MGRNIAGAMSFIVAVACASEPGEGGSDEGSGESSGTGESATTTGPADGSGDATSAPTGAGASTTGGVDGCEGSPWAMGDPGPFAVTPVPKSGPSYPLSRPRVSADGRYVLYTELQLPSQELTMLRVDNACQTTNVLELEGFAADELAAGLDDLEFSADGSTVAFNVRGPRSGQLRVFAFDIEAQTQERIDILADGSEGSGRGDAIAVSGDGRYVAFVSDMQMTAEDDADGIFDAIVRDREAGTTELVSVDDDGIKSSNHVDWTSISSDGQLVAFSAFASSLSPIDDYTTGSHAYVRNRARGVLEFASPQPEGLPMGAATGFNPHVSGSGRWVVFGALHGIADDDDDERDDIYMRDRQTGEVIMVSRGITELLGDVAMSDPFVSDDGQRVLYTVGKNDGSGIFVYLTDLSLEQHVEVAPGHPSFQVDHVRMSADGRWLVEVIGDPQAFDPPLPPGASVVAMRRVDTLLQ